MKPKVLVVDDDVRMQRVMEAMLLPAGYDVIQASNGADAITKATMSSPDVILLDVMMPGMDGFEVALTLRAIAKTKDIPIVMVTALGEVKDRVKALEMGADDFLTKPVDKTELLTRVKTLIEKSERIKQLKVVKKRPLAPIVGISIAVIMAIISTILVVTNEPVTVVEKQIEYRDVVREVEVVKEVIEYRDVVYEIVKEVIVEKPIELREFSSKEDLEKWLAEDKIDETMVFYFTLPDGTDAWSDEFDCDDYAIGLQERALKDGYQMSVTIIEKEAGPHMINLVIIGNGIYYIEPQTDEVWFYVYVDAPV